MDNNCPMTDKEKLALDRFAYQKPDDAQVKDIEATRHAFELTALHIMRTLPECPDRTSTMRMLHAVQMQAIAGIIFRGQYVG